MGASCAKFVVMKLTSRFSSSWLKGGELVESAQ